MNQEAIRKYVVPITTLLSFVSFWRASAIVLCDLGSSAYYVGGISEKAIGKSAPWFILAVMLFSYAVRSIYIESCSMFVRGGVYRVVHQALGGTAAKFSVSALMFDYVLTGPISGVSAGLYLGALINELGEHFHLAWMHVPQAFFAAAVAALVTIYFWYTNRVGIPFSSTRALRIMQLTTVMVVLLIAWCIYTMLTKGFHPVPSPTREHFQFSETALGWLKGTAAPTFTLVAVVIGLGHSVLALSGEESLAQVNREIAAPKQKNLQRTGLIVFVYSLVFTSLVSFFAVMLIPDAERAKYLDNLIGGLSMFMAGPYALRLAFHCFVVLVGVLILSGAVNTAIIGSNGVLNRVTEDGVLPPWFRNPHPKYGTTYQIINLIVGLQLLTIVLSRGNVDMLGEAYAFGVVWSFSMKGLAVVVLRFTHPEADRWKFPFNLRLGKREIPLGLIATTAVLFTLAIVNLFTKEAATIAGGVFTIFFFVAFTLSEKKYGKERRVLKTKRLADKHRPFPETSIEAFRLEVREDLSPSSLNVKAGCALVCVTQEGEMLSLGRALADETVKDQEIVVTWVKPITISDAESQAKPELAFDSKSTRIFSQVVDDAEKIGRPVRLLSLHGQDRSLVLLSASQQLEAGSLWLDASSDTLEAQKAGLLASWNAMPNREGTLKVMIVGNVDGQTAEFALS